MNGTKILLPNNFGSHNVVITGYILPAYEIGDKVGYQRDLDNIETYQECKIQAAYVQYIKVKDNGVEICVPHIEYELDNQDVINEEDVICLVG